MNIKTTPLNAGFEDAISWTLEGDLAVQEPSKILLDLDPGSVQQLTRDGADLVIETVDGQSIKILDFYADNGAGPSQLYLVDEKGEIVWAQLEPAAADGSVAVASYVPQGEMADFGLVTAAESGSDDGVAGWAILGALGAAGTIAAVAAADGSSGGGGGSDNDVDTTAPDAPTDVVVSDDGTTVTGSGEPGTTVTITDSDGNVVGEGTVGDDGQFTVGLDDPQNNGESLDVVVTDGAGNESDPTNITAPDTTAPDAPSDVTVSDDGTTVTGSGEPGTTVTVTDPDGNVVGEGTVGDDGQFTVGLDDPQNNGESLDVVVTDGAGNESDPTNITAPDTTAPDAPSDVTVSDDGTTVTGSGEPGTTVTVTDPDGNVVGEGTVGDDGQFTVDLNEPQTGGESLEVVVTDEAGNESDPTNVTAPDTGGTDDPDTTAPDAPTDVAVSDDGTTVTGSGEPGTTVTVTDPDGTVVGEGTVGDDGQFTVELDDPQNNGESLDVVVTDGAGNESDPTNVVAPDTTAPDAPTDVAVSDDGTTVTGSGESGTTVTVTDPDGTVVGEGTVGDDGQFTVELDDPQNNGESLEVVATDDAGNASDPTSVVAPDTTAPPAPIVNDSDGTVLSGTAEAGSTIDIDVDGDGTPDNTVSADAEGNWSVGFDPALADGTEVSVTASDAAGNTSDPASTTIDADLVDTTPPAAPVISSIEDDVAPVQGNVESGGSTNDTQPTLVGTAEAGSSVEIFQGDTSLGTVTADATGNWSFPLATELADGAYSFTAVATDQAGNTGDASGAFELMVDTTGPSDGDGLNSISFDDGGDELLSADEAASVTLSGQLEAGSTINSLIISDGTNEVTVAAADITVDAAGVVTVAGQDLSGLAEGEITVTAEVTDAAGNTGTITDTTTLDATAPSVALDPLTTGDVTPALSGTVDDAEATVTVTVDGTDYDATNNGDGTWSLADDTLAALPVGDTSVTVTATDAAGNEAAVDAMVTISDGGGGGAASLNFDDGGDELLSADEAASVTLSGQLEPGSAITSLIISDGTTEITVTPADISIDAGTGAITVVGQDLSGLAEGEITVTAEGTDAAGGAISLTDTTTLDVTAPSVALDPLTTGDATPALSGTVDDPNATVTVTVDGTDYDAANNGDGTWSLPDDTLAVLPVGDTTVTVTATDAAGNETALDATVTVSDSVGGANGNLSFDDGGDELLSATEAGNVTLSGELEPGSTITSLIISDGTNEITVAAADITVGAAGVVTVAGQDLSGLADGEITVTAEVEDAAGNTGTITDTTTLDATAPNAPADVTVSDDGTTVTGSGEPGSTVTVTDPDGTVIGEGTVGDGGQFEVTLDTPQVDGEALEVVQADPAGNASDPATIAAPDNTAPNAPADITVSDDGTTITGSGEPGATVTVTDPDGTVVGEGTVGDGGQFEVTLDTPQVDGETLEVVQADPAGNASEPATVTAPDNTAPNAPADVTVSDDGITITGSGEPGATVTVTDPDGTVIGEGTVGDGGQFEVTLDTPQVDGEALEVVQADPAGNASEPATATAPDNTAPNVTMDPLTTDDATPALGGLVNDPDATVTVTVDGTDYDATNNGDGTWSLADDTLAALPVGDTTVTVTAADAAGNETAVDATVTVSDSGGGADGSLSFDDGGDGMLNATEAANVTLSGELEPGGAITSLVISDGTNEVTVAAADISVDPDTGAIAVVGQDLSGLTEGEITVTAEGTNAAGNPISLTDTTTLDATAPEAPADVTVSDDGTTVTGSGEPGATVTVTDPDGMVIGEGTVGDGGQFEVTLDTPQVDGEALEVVQADPAGNASEPATAAAPDNTAPNAPADVAVSDDGTTVTGSGEPGATVTVTDPDGTVIGEGTVGDGGQFEVALDTPQIDGEALEVVQADPAGNASEPATATAPDNTAPNVAMDPLTTDDATPALSGTVDDPEAAVTVTVDGTDYDATNNGDGTWSLADDTLAALPVGDTTVTVTATDAAGNATTADATVTVSDGGGGVTASLSFDDGGDELLSADEAANVTLSGELEPGSTITSLIISDGTNEITVAAADITVGGAGVVSVAGQDLSGLVDGEITVTAEVTDAAGNTGTITDTTTLDATAPTVALDPLTTGDSTPALSGTVDDPDATITVSVDGTDYDATNNGDGTWSLADDTLAELPEGDSTITVTATDAAGNETAVDETVTVDTTGPSDGDGLNSIGFDDGGDELLSVDEAANVTLSGQLEAGSSITSLVISDGTNEITVAAADITVGGAGVVTVAGQDLSGLVDGEITVTAEVTDAAGNTGTITDTTTLDATAPTVALDPLTTGDSTPALSGTVDDPDATITVTVDGTDYDATNNGDGTWSLADDTLAALPVGDTTVTVTAADAAGNETAVDATVTISDGSGGVTASLSFDDGGDELLSADEAANVTLSGELEPGSTITSLVISDGTNEITVAAADITVGAGGVVTVAGQDLSGLADGEITVTAEGTDAAGGAISLTDTTTLDVTAPSVALDPLTTDDATPALSGTVDDPDATVTVTVDGTDYDATNNGDGTWSLADDTLAALPVGDTTVTVTAADAAGNETAVDATVTISDGSGGVTASLSFDDGGDELLSADEAANVTLSGELEPGSTITSLIISDGANEITVAAADITVGAGGVVTVAGQDLSGLADGEITVTAEGTDAAGGAISLTDTTTLDATAPTVALDPLTTGDSTPALSGTVDDPDATVTVTVDGTDYDATNNGDGTWSLPDDTLAALPEGDTAITVTATDSAGNETAVDATVSVDTTGPSDGDGLNSVSFDDGGDELLSVDEAASVTLSGQLEAGSSITSLVISDGTNEVTVAAADITVGAAGVVTVAGQDLSGLADGEITVTAEVEDAAGNTGTITDTTTLDATAPTVALDPLTTDDVTPALSGTVDDPDATVTVTVDGTDYDATNNGDGTWSLADDTLAALPVGDATVTVTATDPAGNETAVDATITISDGGGGVTASLGFDDGGDEVLNADEAASVTLSGQLEPGSAITSLIISDGTTEITVAPADISIDAGTGAITVVGQDLSGLADGEITVTAEGTDAAGGAISLTDTTTLDVTAPGVALDPLTTGDSTPALSGTVDDPDATVTVTVDGTDYDATNNGDGTWSLPDDTLAALPEGDTAITVTATDSAGNETAVDATVSVDTTGPSDGDGLNSVSFDDGGDEVLSADEAANVTLSGQLEAGSSITSLVISDGTNEITVAAADITVGGAGVVTVAGQDLSGLADGEITVTAEVTDAAGNTGTITDTTTLNIAAPSAPTIALANDTGVAGDDGITSDGVVNVTDLVADGTWEYSTDGGTTWEVGSGGSFELPEDSYADGNVQVRQSDSAGNISAVASLGAIVVDATGPGQPTLAIAEADDGLIDSGEMGDGIQTEVTLGANTEVGDTLTLMVDDGAGNTVNTIDYTVTADDVADGFSSVTIPVWLDNGSYSVTASASDAAGNVSAASGAVSFDVDATAPFVNVSSSGLLGLIGVDALGLVDLSNQVFSAYDPNNNLQSVTIEMGTVLSITQILSLLGLGEDSLNYSQNLANELGLQVEFEEMFMLPLLGGQPATLTITAADGGTIDNLAINEFLATVSMGGGLLGTDVNVLPTFTITGTAADGQVGTDTATELADLSLLNPDSSFITEGTSDADTLEGTNDGDRLYGFEGNDTLIGGGGNDILRGGAGDDTLQISDDTFIMVDGGDGFDTLQLDGGFDLDVTQVEGGMQNLERIDLVDGDAGSTLTLDEDSVIELTDADNILQIAGDEADTLNVSGAAATGNQQTIDGSVYAEYDLGSTTLLVDETVNVEVA